MAGGRSPGICKREEDFVPRAERVGAFCFPWLGPPLEGDLGHGTARETMSRMPVVQIRRRIRTPRGISTDSCCCLQPLVLSAVRPSVYYRCLLVPHSVTQLLEQRWTCSSKHALTGCLLSLHLRMSLALGPLDAPGPCFRFWRRRLGAAHYY